MQSSFERLQGAVDTAGLLASPSTSVDSKGTGATGSTEAPGAATQSLIASITGSSMRRTTPTLSLSAKSFHSSATTPWEDVTNGRSASGGNRPSGKPHRVAPSSSGDSWSDVGRSSQPWADVRGDGTAGNVEDASAGVDLGALIGEYARSESSQVEASIPVTDEEEVEGLSYSIDRGSERFNDWLAETSVAARGDGTSSHGGDDQELDDTASHARGRINSRYPSSRFSSVTSSDFEQQSTSEFISVALGGFIPHDLRSDSVSAADLASLLPSEILSVRLDDDTASIKLEQVTHLGVKDEAADEKPALRETPEPESSDEAASESSSSDRSVPSTSEPWMWKGLSAVLALALAASVGHSTLRALAPGASALAAEAEQITVLITGNITDAFPDPILLGTPLSVSALVAIAIVAASSITYALKPSTRATSSASIPLLCNVRSSINSDGPKKDPARATREARACMVEGERLYQLGGLNGASTAFESASKLAVLPRDKATANEWLGRTRYRQSRLERSPRLVHAAIACFERAVRFDQTQATSRASWGRCLFALGDYAAAEKVLLGALRRDASLAFAHEFLGKTLVALRRWNEAEPALREAIRLDPYAYSTLAFLGEQLHVRKQPREARMALEAAVALRHDFPAAHARLAMLATEASESERAVQHWQAVLQYRAAGCVDDNLPRTTPAIHGTAPFLSLYFATSTKTGLEDRIRVLRQAAAQYPDNALVSVILAINLRRSKGRDDRGAGLAELRAREEQLELRVGREDGDLDAKGLFALVLLGLGKTKRAEGQYATFWETLATRPRSEVKEKSRDLAFVSMAFSELQSK